VKLVIVDDGQPRMTSRDGHFIDNNLILAVLPNDVPTAPDETSSNLAAFGVAHNGFEVTAGGVQHGEVEFSNRRTKLTPNDCFAVKDG
ncbi:MAG TPA: hypothetical protein VFG14_05730, partial [Chthoniobacteraceae bacterium]|nr:hypothetical protein [Chthoniobacteraceae bacterium]